MRLAKAPDAPSPAKRKKRFNPLGPLAILLAVVAVDSIADPGIADSTIGDGPDDTITAQVFQCAGTTGPIRYAHSPIPGTYCLPVIDLRVPVLIRRHE